MLDYSKVRFLWRGDAGRKVSSGRYDKIYDMGPRAATGDASFSTAATRPVVDEYGTYRGLLVEPGATNLMLRSQEFNTTWVPINCTVTADATTAPDGTLTADKIVASSLASDSKRLEQNFSATSGTTYTVSAFFKASEWGFAFFNSPEAVFTTREDCFLNLSTGVLSGGGASFGRVQALPNGWYRLSYTRTATATATTSFRFGFSNTASITSTGDGTSGIFIWQAQLETGSVATSPIVTTAGTASRSATVAPIVDAIPVTGTVIVWDNLLNAYPSGADKVILGSENLSTTFVSLVKDATNTNQLNVRVHNNTEAATADLLWQSTNTFKRWFFAMTFNGSTVELWRGDIQGNITKVLSTAYTPGTAAIRDLFLASTATPDGQTSDSFLDIMTYDAVMTEAEIQEIYYGTIPVFQQTGYAGTFVDKFRQKVQAEPSSTYDTTLESTVLADWSEDIFGVYDADASAFFSRGFEDGATLENLDATNTFILALKAL